MKEIRQSVLRFAVLALAVAPSHGNGAPAKGTLTGHARIPAVVGRPVAQWFPVEGASLFLSPEGEKTGLSIFCPDGNFSFEIPLGTYWGLIEPSGPHQRGAILEPIEIEEGKTEWNPELRLDYNCPFSGITRGGVYEQTFLARGTSITSASFKLAGMFESAILSVSLRKSLNGEQIGPEHVIEPEENPDIAVTWRSDEVPTVPGETYVLRIADIDEEPFGLYVQMDQGLGYPFGELFINGEKSGYDGFFSIGSNADGAILTYSASPGEPWESMPDSRFQSFISRGTSLAGIFAPFDADGEVSEIKFAVWQHYADPDAKQVGTTKTTVPALVDGKRYHAGVAYAQGEVPLTPGETYAVAISCPASEGISPLKAEAAENPGAGLAIRIYEYAPEKVKFELPPPPLWEPDGSEQTLQLSNADFEEGTDSGWESAWGGRPFAAIVGSEWMVDKFSGDATRPKEGNYCAGIATDHTRVKKLIRQWASWDYPSKNGQVRAVVWVASSDNAGRSESPARVRICVSGHGSVDAGNVAWSEPVVSPGKWTPLVSPPATPAGGKMTLFLLVEGGNETEEQYVKIDDLRLIVDKK